MDEEASCKQGGSQAWCFQGMPVPIPHPPGCPSAGRLFGGGQRMLPCGFVAQRGLLHPFLTHWQRFTAEVAKYGVWFGLGREEQEEEPSPGSVRLLERRSCAGSPRVPQLEQDTAAGLAPAATRPEQPGARGRMERPQAEAAAPSPSCSAPSLCQGTSGPSPAGPGAGHASEEHPHLAPRGVSE